jgi:hypothetical protein
MQSLMKNEPADLLEQETRAQEEDDIIFNNQMNWLAGKKK